MKKSFLIVFLCGLILTACQQEWAVPSEMEESRIVFRLYDAAYEGETLNRQASVKNAGKMYDRVEFYVVDEAGRVVSNLKGFYDASSSAIQVEGLQEGEYTLLVLGIKGDERQDEVSIRKLQSLSDLWLIFPEHLSRPLQADYFYSNTPFSVHKELGADGWETVVSAPSLVRQKRVAGRVDFSFAFRNPYVRTAVVHKSVDWSEASFFTALSGDGGLSGEARLKLSPLSLDSDTSFCLLPVSDGVPLQGEVTVLTRDYRGNEVERTFDFEMEPVVGNHIHQVYTPVVHPDDESGLMFVTTQAYDEGQHAQILHDAEPKAVYTDAGQRSFNTSRPLQVEAVADGRLHVRFYSPRALKGVLIRARFPSVSDEYLDLAYFDSIPAFADFYAPIPLFSTGGMYRTVSGKWLNLPCQEADLASEATFEISSADVYWEKLQAIRHGWNISFNLYGGDPDKPDGGPTGNWMGIRPVHCREVVAFFLNFTYMIDMPQHEEILCANEDRLYGNGGVTDKVTAETVLRQMRQARSIRVGLVYTGNGVLGLGGGDVFGAYQGAWLNHYADAYACEIMFHELGHVMGYSHDSSFTYGPWAQELMNRFYVDHLQEMPIDSSDYLNSKKNPCLYL